MTFGLDRQFHVGFVVADLSEAMEALADALKVHWTPIQATVSDAWMKEGRRQIPIRWAYTAEAPHIELIEEVQGTVWMAPDGGGSHHLGYWVDDLAATAQWLESHGFVNDLKGASDDHDGPHRMTYHRHRITGLRLELVDASILPAMEALWASVAE